MKTDEAGASELPEQTSGQPEQTTDLAGQTSGQPEQTRVRLAKLAAIRAAGGDPYPAGFPRTATIAGVRRRYPDLGPGVATGDRVGVTGLARGAAANTR